MRGTITVNIKASTIAMIEPNVNIFEVAGFIVPKAIIRKSIGKSK